MVTKSDQPDRLSRRTFIRRSSLAAIGVGAAPAALGNALGAAPSSTSRTKPNVLLILTDQQRIDSLGCYGAATAVTPHCDALAKDGVRFERAYASQPVCSPARSSILTGLFPHKTEVWDNDLAMLDHSRSFPKIMHDLGYVTGHIGKWHLGPHPQPDLRSDDKISAEPAPPFFNVWQGYDNGVSHWIGEPRNKWVVPHNHETAIPDFSGFRRAFYRSDRETDQAIAFLRENQRRPFCLTVSYYPPHTPWTAPEENCLRFKGQVRYPVYHAMVNRLDENIGRLTKAVDELGIRENTLIVFTSDHGHHFVERWNSQPKRNCYDAASRVPLVFNWRGELPAGTRGSLVSHVDIAPTILDLCGVPVANGLHGRSMKDLIFQPNQSWNDSVYIQNHPFRQDAFHARKRGWATMIERCVVKDEWKLILNTLRPPELYSLVNDPGENTNLWAQTSLNDVKQSLLARMEDWARKTGDAIVLSPWLLYRWKV